MNDPQQAGDGFTVHWSDINYQIDAYQAQWCRWSTRREPQGSNRSNHILHGLNGHFKSGEMVAVMGPSGAGKTTFLECLTGRRVAGLTGNITVGLDDRHGGDDRQQHRRHLAISIVPQIDHLFGQLTVRESLRWASRFKNSSTTAAGHERIVSKILRDSGLTDCGDTVVDELSGGERKKVTIAQELVTKVDILFLDEPTSGLDATSTFKLVLHFTRLVDTWSAEGKPIAIVATIHQPPTRVYQLFRRVYFLSGGGRAIYDGPPQGVLPLVAALSRNTLTCPATTNEADFITEIAAGEHGSEILLQLASHLTTSHQQQQQQRTVTTPNTNTGNRNELARFMRQDTPTPSNGIIRFLRQTRDCARRGLVVTLKNRLFMTCRLLVHLITPLVGSTLYLDRTVRDESGCPTRSVAMWHQNYTQLARMPHEQAQKLEAHYEYVNIATLHMVFVTLALYLVVTTGLLVWPLELAILQRERANRWYSTGAYAIGRGLSDLPLLATLPVLLVTWSYYLQGELTGGWWHFGMIALITVAASLVAESLSQLVSLLMPGGVATVAFGAVFMFALLSATNFCILAEDASWAARLVIDNNPTSVFFRILLLLRYGFGHCECDWPLLDYEAPADWVACMTFPDAEIDYTRLCLGNEWTLTEVLQQITSGGRYDRSICQSHVTHYSDAVMQGARLRTSIDEMTHYRAQPRGIRAYKPLIYQSNLLSMYGIDETLMWPLICRLFATTIIIRALSMLIMSFKNTRK